MSVPRPAMMADDDAILTCDSGTIATRAARYWAIRDNREFYLSGDLALMAPGLNEPPMPGNVRYEQAKLFTEAFLRGESHNVATMTTVARDKINELRS